MKALFWIGLAVLALGLASLRWKVLVTHSIERRSDQVSIRFEQPHWHFRKLNIESFRAILEHSRVLRRIILRDSI